MITMNTLDLVKQGSPVVIAAAINKALGDQGITVRATGYNKRLILFIEYHITPNRDILVDFIKNTIVDLKPTNVSQVTIRGSAVGQTTDAWQETFSLSSSEPSKPVRSASAQSTPRVVPSFATPLRSSSEYSSLSSALAKPQNDVLGLGVLTLLLIVHTGFFFDSIRLNFNQQALGQTASPCVLLK